MPNLSDTEPLDETDPKHERFLADLQCNILSSHGRPNVHYFFLHFPTSDSSLVQRVLGALSRGALGDVPRGLELGSELSSRGLRMRARAKRGSDASGPEGVTQRGSDAFSKEPTTFWTNLLLSARCYEDFLQPFVAPPDTAFRSGLPGRDETLKKAAPRLNDPDLSKGAPPVHALYAVGYDPAEVHFQPVRNGIRKYLDENGVQYREEAGYVLRHAKRGYPIEPFGYRDSISQPLFYESDLEARRRFEGLAATPRGGQWSSFAPLSTVLVPDPNGDPERSYGSYFVYRKLKQDVDRFYSEATRLAGKISPLPEGSLTPEDVADRLIGRKADGRPLVSRDPEYTDYNDFAYDSQSACPVHAHARKVNPRDTYTRIRIARRSTVYGPRLQRGDDGRPILKDGASVRSEEDRDKQFADGVGLMFFCCQADIAGQFEVIQAAWANGRHGGADTVIGQLPPGKVNKIGFNGSGLKYDCEPVVEVLEGEYFFAPSLSFFAKL